VPFRPWDNVFFGPDIDATAAEALLETAAALGVLADRCVEVQEYARRVAEHIAGGRAVGLVYGRMEFGPRALGHRSVLAEATDASINDSLNARLKRTEFMPFAPVTLRKDAARCYKGWREDHTCSQYMTMCYTTTDEFRRLCPAVVHVDGTARPQVVDERDGLYHDIVKAYVDKTSCPALVNTSFNTHGEPIVCSVADAWRGFYDQDCCDVLALFPFIFVKRSPEAPGGCANGSAVKRLRVGDSSHS